MTAERRFNLKIRDHLDSPERKREYNEQHFGVAAGHYDFATRAMSLGRDVAWKRKLVQALPALESPTCVDLACGTGDVAFLLAERFPAGRIVGVDLTESMLEIARRRNGSPLVSFQRQDIGALELPAGCADLVTGSYAVRNAPDLRQALAEIRRILKPAGQVALLDFSKSPRSWFQFLQCLVLKYWCGFWGLVLHGNPEIHSYIAASLQAFPDREELRSLLGEAGFEVQQAERFCLGTLELLVLRKAG